MIMLQRKKRACIYYALSSIIYLKIMPEILEGLFVFMQNIRRATKKHRTVLLVVVIILAIGLVGSFAISGMSGQRGMGSGMMGNDWTLDMQIAAYLRHIATLEAEPQEYANYLSIARSYMELSSLYAEKYSLAIDELPVLDPPELDEDGNEIPLDEERQAARAIAEAELEAAQTAAEAWYDYCKNSAGWAEHYYQLALDNLPEGINNAAIADIKFDQAKARDIQGDVEGTIAFVEEAHALVPDNVNYLLALATLEKARYNTEGALLRYEQASAIYPDNAGFLANQATLHGELGNYEQARELFLRARELDPLNYEIAYSHANFLFWQESYEAGFAELTAYRDSLPENHPNIEKADEGIEYFQMILDWLGGMNIDEDEDEDEEAPKTEGEDADAGDDDTADAEDDDAAE